MNTTKCMQIHTLTLSSRMISCIRMTISLYFNKPKATPVYRSRILNNNKKGILVVNEIFVINTLHYEDKVEILLDYCLENPLKWFRSSFKINYTDLISSDKSFSLVNKPYLNCTIIYDMKKPLELGILEEAIFPNFLFHLSAVEEIHAQKYMYREDLNTSISGESSFIQQKEISGIIEDIRFLTLKLVLLWKPKILIPILILVYMIKNTRYRTVVGYVEEKFVKEIAFNAKEFLNLLCENWENHLFRTLGLLINLPASQQPPTEDTYPKPHLLSIISVFFLEIHVNIVLMAIILTLFIRKYYLLLASKLPLLLSYFGNRIISKSKNKHFTLIKYCFTYENETSIKLKEAAMAIAKTGNLTEHPRFSDIGGQISTKPDDFLLDTCWIWEYEWKIVNTSNDKSAPSHIQNKELGREKGHLGKASTRLWIRKCYCIDS